MKKILSIVLLASSAALAEPEPKLDMRTSIQTISAWSATNVIGFVAHRAKLTVQYSDGVQTNAVKFRFKTEGLSSRTLLDWALHFLNAHATVDANVLRVGGGMPPPLPDGKPLATSQSLSNPFPRNDGFLKPHRVDETIDFVLHVAKHGNVVMGPDSSIFQTKVTMDPQSRSTAEILEDLCDQAGLQCTLHGKVLFIRKKEEKELPNQSMDNDKK